MTCMKSSFAGAAMLLVACIYPTGERDIAGIHVSPVTLSLVVGDTEQPTVQAVEASGRSAPAVFTWSSNDPNVASVDREIGKITAVSAGSTTIIATTGGFTAFVAVTVRDGGPAASISITQPELSLAAGTSATLQAVAVDSVGKKAAGVIVWSSSDASVARVGGASGIVTAIAKGNAIVTATAGAVSGSVIVYVDDSVPFIQWATSAVASDAYGTDDWSAVQATGAPDVYGCSPSGKSWASGRQSVEWLEVAFDRAVLASEVRIYQVWDVYALVKVEVKTASGTYLTVFTYNAQTGPLLPCPRILSINTGGLTTTISGVRMTLDQSGRELWLSGIDAVQLVRR